MIHWVPIFLLVPILLIILTDKNTHQSRESSVKPDQSTGGQSLTRKLWNGHPSVHA